jgi:pyruvate/2-oxoglutarate dehydrogenase complex dihydrolipoamide dehydrogenase (E3) component
LTAPHIIIAAGAKPLIPALPGLSDAPYYTSDTIWQLSALPKQLVVLGGGPVGCELAQCFARLGSAVTLVQRRDRLLPREDPEFSTLLQQQLHAEGITLALNCTAHAVTQTATEYYLTAQQDGETVQFPFDVLLLALGRVANTQGYGLEALNIRLRDDQTIAANEFLQTSCPSIYVCGDVTGPYQFTHVASHQAWFASVNALFGRFKRFAVDYRVIPHVTFTEPEIAQVGLNEQQAKAQGIAYEVTTYALSDLDRAIADETASGLVKVLTVPGKDRILGATIAGAHAGETVTEWVTAMRHGFGLNKILGTVHAYPTFAEANKYAAGAWKRAHQPTTLLHWLAKYHKWERGE